MSYDELIKSLRQIEEDEIEESNGKLTYQEKYDSYWKEIVENKDGTINKDQLARELFDYSFLLNNVPKVYGEVTGGNLSYLNYEANTVIEAYQHHINRHYVEKEDLCDIILNFSDNLSCEEFKQMLIEEFELKNTWAYEYFLEEKEGEN